MTLETVIKKECCIILNNTTKTEVLIELMESLKESGAVQDLDALKKDIFYREQLMSTGLGLGIAIPHVRFKEITEPVIAMGVQPKEIPDYESLDRNPVNIVIMILVGPDQHKIHIRLLSQLMAKLKNDDFREKLILSQNGEDLYSLMADKS